MILDESGSIGCCTQNVRNGVLSFVSSFSALNTIGGTANLGLIEFSSTAQLVLPPGSNCQGGRKQEKREKKKKKKCFSSFLLVMCTLDSTYVQQVSNYVTSNAGGVSGYRFVLSLLKHALF